ncbi:MAG: nucleotidyltransferase domain-containing protein [Candidatus Delongbacteria bacterium]|nr:nucleotidyltransferase domain-containing protein [Candidatus Delongbacteria bacterium]
MIKILKKFKKENEVKYKLLRIALFGSCGRNESGADSDIDIAVEISDPDIYILGDIKYDLEKIYNRKIDLIRLREKMNSVLKERIEKEGIFV